jgi:hypothetical protein
MFLGFRGREQELTAIRADIRLLDQRLAAIECFIRMAMETAR